jgi:hypothetical protein
MLVSSQETCPLPEHPVLAELSSNLNRFGAWAQLFDHEYRLVYITDDFRLSQGGYAEMIPVPLGAFMFGPEYVDAMLGWSSGIGWSLDTARETFSAVGPWALADVPGGREELREKVDPRLRDLVDELLPDEESTSLFYLASGLIFGETPYDAKQFAERIHDPQGQVVGIMNQSMTPVGMATLGALGSIGDLGHFERMMGVTKAGRRPAAILFADLEGSSALARRLPTASYFNLGRRLARAADQCVIDSGGLVGRHVGDGVVAFFLTNTAGSESAAARGCIAAARALREAIADVAARSELAPEDLVLRFGLHWGPNSTSATSLPPGARRSPRSATR